MLQSALRLRGAESLLLAAIFACCVSSGIARESSQPKGDPLSEVIIKAKRIPERIPDEELTTRVEAALQSEKYICCLDHVTFSVINGVLRLEGSVSEDSDLIALLRHVRKIPGVRRIVNELDLDSPGGN